VLQILLGRIEEAARYLKVLCITISILLDRVSIEAFGSSRM
jgi:hypothetical protein